jgi:hypothetical protein
VTTHVKKLCHDKAENVNITPVHVWLCKGYITIALDELVVSTMSILNYKGLTEIIAP